MQQPARPRRRRPIRRLQPDVTVKYGVMLGLPPELPPELPKDAPKDDGGDAEDSIAAKLPPEVIAALRRHPRSCAKLPAGVDPTDNVHIKLRAVFATDGTLVREPILMAAPPSAKGVAAGEVRHERAPGLPALQDAAGGQIRGMEGAGSAVQPAGFWRLL